MLKPQWPYKGKFTVTQGYHATLKGVYEDDIHGALDIVPNYVEGQQWPTPIYACLPGTALNISNTDPARGKGIRVRTKLDQPFIDYLKSKNLVPNEYTGNVFLEVLQWHCLEVTDLDGVVDQNTPIAITGNTGNVYSDGKPVPDSQKGKPPYPGLHNHFEMVVKGDYITFNTSKDRKGRVDPYIVMAYQPTGEDMFPAVQFKGEPTVFAQSGRTLFPFSSGQSFAHAGGDFSQVTVVDPSEKGKYDIRMESPINKA